MHYIITIAVLLSPATKLGQGYIFTGICHSVNGGGLPQCMLGYPPPREQTTPQEQIPQKQAPPPGAGTPVANTDPGAEHAGRYRQSGGGTHPTGMQSCFCLHFQRLNWCGLRKNFNSGCGIATKNKN